MQFVVRERVRGLKLPAARARGALLAELARELRTLRDKHDNYKFGKAIDFTFDFRRQKAVGDKIVLDRPWIGKRSVGRTPTR